MPDFLGINPVFSILGIFALGVALAFYFSWRRGKDLAELAASLGLTFMAEGPEAYSLESTGLEIFRLGRSRKASNLIQVPGPVGLIKIFDYKYVTGGGKNSSTHRFTLALIDCGGCPVPVFDLKPENFLYKIGEMIGFKDIDLPAFPVFSDKYRLTGPDEAALHMFFTPHRAAWFERNQGLNVQGAPGHMVLFRGMDALPVKSWQSFIEEAKIFSSEVLK